MFFLCTILVGTWHWTTAAKTWNPREGMDATLQMQCFLLLGPFDSIISVVYRWGPPPFVQWTLWDKAVDSLELDLVRRRPERQSPAPQYISCVQLCSTLRKLVCFSLEHRLDVETGRLSRPESMAFIASLLLPSLILQPSTESKGLEGESIPGPWMGVTQL